MTKHIVVKIGLIVVIIAGLLWYVFFAKQYQTYIYVNDKGVKAVLTVYKTNIERFYDNANLQFKGKKYRLKTTLSASGARYATANEELIFWSKGGEATIIMGEKEYRVVLKK